MFTKLLSSIPSFTPLSTISSLSSRYFSRRAKVVYSKRPSSSPSIIINENGIPSNITKSSEELQSILEKRVSKLKKHKQYAHIRPLPKLTRKRIELEFTVRTRRIKPVYPDIEVDIYNLNNEKTGKKIVLNGNVFNLPLRKDILQRCVEYHRAKRRTKTYKTKDRSEVSGSGKKKWNQKGSGRARAGNGRAPHWVGGGVSHGPVVRSFAKGLQKKVIALGVKTALSARLAEDKLRIIDTESVGIIF